MCSGRHSCSWTRSPWGSRPRSSRRSSSSCGCWPRRAPGFIANCITHGDHHRLYYDALSRITWNDQVGFGVFETSCNSQGGTRRPVIYLGSVGEDGWHPDALPLHP